MIFSDKCRPVLVLAIRKKELRQKAAINRDIASHLHEDISTSGWWQLMRLQRENRRRDIAKRVAHRSIARVTI